MARGCPSELARPRACALDLGAVAFRQPAADAERHVHHDRAGMIGGDRAVQGRQRGGDGLPDRPAAGPAGLQGHAEHRGQQQDPGHRGGDTPGRGTPARGPPSRAGPAGAARPGRGRARAASQPSVLPPSNAAGTSASSASRSASRNADSPGSCTSQVNGMTPDTRTPPTATGAGR